MSRRTTDGSASTARGRGCGANMLFLAFLAFSSWSLPLESRTRQKHPTTTKMPTITTARTAVDESLPPDSERSRIASDGPARTRGLCSRVDRKGLHGARNSKTLPIPHILSPATPKFSVAGNLARNAAGRFPRVFQFVGRPIGKSLNSICR